MTQTSQFALDWIKSVILILSGQADQTDVVCFYPVLDRYRHIYILYRGRQGQPTETGKGNTRLPSFHHKRGLHLTIRIKHNLQESLSSLCMLINTNVLDAGVVMTRGRNKNDQTNVCRSLLQPDPCPFPHYFQLDEFTCSGCRRCLMSSGNDISSRTSNCAHCEALSRAPVTHM